MEERPSSLFMIRFGHPSSRSVNVPELCQPTAFIVGGGQPARGDSILYRPDSGYSDGRGSSRMSDRDSHRDRSPMLSDYGRSSFEAIADFARRQGGGRSRDDSHDRDINEINVPNDTIKVVFDKRGVKINEIRNRWLIGFNFPSPLHS